MIKKQDQQLATTTPPARNKNIKSIVMLCIASKNLVNALVYIYIDMTLKRLRISIINLRQ